MQAQKVTDILALTQDLMLALIEERWDDLMEMQLRQDVMLQTLFSQRDLMLSDQEKNDLLEVQRLNQGVLCSTKDFKADVAKELRAMQQGKAKANAYQAV